MRCGPDKTSFERYLKTDDARTAEPWQLDALATLVWPGERAREGAFERIRAQLAACDEESRPR